MTAKKTTGERSVHNSLDSPYTGHNYKLKCGNTNSFGIQLELKSQFVMTETAETFPTHDSKSSLMTIVDDEFHSQPSHTIHYA